MKKQEAVEEYNRKNPAMLIVDSDPSPMIVDITIMLLSWYQLYRRNFPAKDEEDIKDLGTLKNVLAYFTSNDIINITHILHIC